MFYNALVTVEHVRQAAAILLRYQSVEAAIAAIRHRHDVFISYKSDDAPFANEVREKLSRRGLTVFLAEASIDAGGDWEQGIFDALAGSRVIVFLVTPRSIGSAWCNYEVGAARALGKRLISALRHVNAADLPLALSRLQAVEVQTARQITGLVQTLRRLCSESPA